MLFINVSHSRNLPDPSWILNWWLSSLQEVSVLLLPFSFPMVTASCLLWILFLSAQFFQVSLYSGCGFLGSSFASDPALYIGACCQLLWGSLIFAANPSDSLSFSPASTSCSPHSLQGHLYRRWVSPGLLSKNSQASKTNVHVQLAMLTLFA